MKTRDYRLSAPRFGRRVCFALVSDLHGEDPEGALAVLRQRKPDYILMAGDILEPLNGEEDVAHERGFRLLSEASKIAPVLYCTGNHEDGGIHSWRRSWKKKSRKRDYHEDDRLRILQSGAIFLEDSFAVRGGIAFGGLQSGLIHEGGMPALSWLDEFCGLDCPRVLLCHHPEYYEKYLRDRSLDLIVSGHAHGGQWRIFGKGVFAPGQGLFPQYTHGLHDDRFVIGAGLKKGSILVPRFFNSPEVVFIEGT